MEGYHPLGDLWIDLSGEGPVRNYHRQLDVRDAVVRVRYTRGGVTYTREVFASHPDQVIGESGKSVIGVDIPN